MRTAKEIYQENLDSVAVCLWAHDYEGVCNLLVIPDGLYIGDGYATVKDRQGLLRHVETYRSRLEQLGAEGYHRLCLEASFVGEAGGRIRGRHRTFVLRGGKRLIDPYDGEMDLLRMPDGWKASALKVRDPNEALSFIDPSAFLRREHGSGQSL